MAVLDPFADPPGEHEPAGSPEGLTLNLGREIALTLATHALIITDERREHQSRWACCGLGPNNTRSAKAIPFHNVLWADVSDDTLSISYVDGRTNKRPCVGCVQYFLEKPSETWVSTWVSQLLERAYGKAKKRRKAKLLINPFGGTGNAERIYLQSVKPVLMAAKWDIEMEQTMHRGHATQISETLDTSQFDVVACCSGDGLPHEVFNGLGRRADASEALSRIAVVQLPCGTGNAMSLNLNGTDDPTLAALAIVKGLETPLDLTSITQGDQRLLSFLSQSVGMVAEVDLGTEKLRWMGSFRFTYGFFVRIMRKTIWPCELAAEVVLKDKVSIKDHYRNFVNGSNHAGSTHSTEKPRSIELPALSFGTVQSEQPSSFSVIPAHKIGNFYAGNMAFMAPNAEFFPASLPSDGLLDMITVDGDIGRAAAIKSFLAVENGKFFDFPDVYCRKVSGYRIKPLGTAGGFIAIDGEEFPYEEFQAEVHRGLGRTLSRSQTKYEGRGIT